MTGILNLTKDAVRIGDVTIEPSGSVARVEHDRRLSVREPICEATDGGYITIGSDDIPIYEQTPREIVVESKFWGCVRRLGDGMNDDDTNEPGYFGVGESQILIVEREVAEAAAIMRHECRRGCIIANKMMEACDNDGKPHPLASRMVWAANPVTEPQGGPQTQEVMFGTLHRAHVVIGYRELRRVGGVG